MGVIGQRFILIRYKLGLNVDNFELNLFNWPCLLNFYFNWNFFIAFVLSFSFFALNLTVHWFLRKWICWLAFDNPFFSFPSPECFWPVHSYIKEGWLQSISCLIFVFLGILNSINWTDMNCWSKRICMQDHVHDHTHTHTHTFVWNVCEILPRMINEIVRNFKLF